MKQIQEYTLLIILAIILVAFIFTQPAMEANTFNKLTGGDATYWDAFFSNLRITGCQ